ncbi:MAG: baseplate J/gp47 family protein [Bacteroides sp.]|nr:baseplate J/gp47 family protein [Bacteroides sp.]
MRPLTDCVSVIAPEAVSYDIDLTYYISSKEAATAAQTENNIKAAAEAFTLWQSEKLGRDINPSYLIQLIMQAGAKRAEIREPVYTVLKSHQAARVGSIELINGGIEEE